MGLMDKATDAAFSDKSAGDASRDAGKKNRQWQKDALDYQIEQDKTPSRLREGALDQLGGLYGVGSAPDRNDLIDEVMDNINESDHFKSNLRDSQEFTDIIDGLLAGDYGPDTDIDELMASIPGGPKFKKKVAGSQDIKDMFGDILGGKYAPKDSGDVQQGMIDDARNAPLYGAIMGGQKAGNEQIMRNASMTGGLRSGDVNRNFMDFNTQLQNQALLQSYNERLGGVQGLANLPSNANAIAGQMNNIGQDYGMSIVGAAQSEAAAKQQNIDNFMGVAKMGAGFSDRRLKKDIVKVGERSGLNVYTWVWNKVAESLGLSGESVGYMADEVKYKYPEAISYESGYMKVNYGGVV